MKKSSYFISFGGVLTTLTVVLQSAPIFLPTIGLFMSPLSTLPIALATIASLGLGISLFFASFLILSLISLQEAIILLFTTGLLGFSIGSFLFRKGIFNSIFYSGILLTMGIAILTYLIGIPGFKAITKLYHITIVFLIYLLFSILYSAIWNIIIKKFRSRLDEWFISL